MEVLPKSELEKIIYERNLERGMSEEDAAFDAQSTGATILWPEGRILVPTGTSSRRKLHEVGHKVTGLRKFLEDKEEWTVGDAAYNEVLAEKFAWEARGKEVTYRVGLPAVLTLNYEEKMSPRESVGVVIQVLREMRIPVTQRDKRFMFNWLRRYRRVV